MYGRRSLINHQDFVVKSSPRFCFFCSRSMNSYMCVFLGVWASWASGRPIPQRHGGTKALSARQPASQDGVTSMCVHPHTMQHPLRRTAQLQSRSGWWQARRRLGKAPRVPRAASLLTANSVCTRASQERRLLLALCFLLAPGHSAAGAMLLVLMSDFSSMGLAHLSEPLSCLNQFSLLPVMVTATTTTAVVSTAFMRGVNT